MKLLRDDRGVPIYSTLQAARALGWQQERIVTLCALGLLRSTRKGPNRNDPYRIRHADLVMYAGARDMEAAVALLDRVKADEIKALEHIGACWWSPREVGDHFVISANQIGILCECGYIAHRKVGPPGKSGSFRQIHIREVRRLAKRWAPPVEETE